MSQYYQHLANLRFESNIKDKVKARMQKEFSKSDSKTIGLVLEIEGGTKHPTNKRLKNLCDLHKESKKWKN